MTRELVDYRLHLYRARNATDAAGHSFACNVTWNQRDPILEIPRRKGGPDLPSGETDVRVPDGAVWRLCAQHGRCLAGASPAERRPS